MRLSRIFVLSMLVLASACYHATIETGLAPSGQTVSKPWASSFIAGLVPPSTVETMAKCPHGVSKVETQLSFLNQVVNIVTLGIFTPMTIEVQCAAPKTSQGPATEKKVSVQASSSVEQQQEAVAKAARISAEAHEPVTVVFE